MPRSKRKLSPTARIDDHLVTKKPRSGKAKSSSPVASSIPPPSLTHYLPGVSVEPPTEPSAPPSDTLTLRIHGVDDRPTCQWHCAEQVNWLDTPDDHGQEKYQQCEACVYIKNETERARVVVWRSSDDDFRLYRVSRRNKDRIQTTTDPILLEVELGRYPRQNDEHTSEVLAHRALSVLVTGMSGMFTGKDVYLMLIGPPPETIDDASFRLRQLLIFRSLRCRRLVVYMADAPTRFHEVADRVIKEVQGGYPALDLFDLRLQIKQLPQVRRRDRYQTDLEDFFIHIVRGDMASCREGFQSLLGKILEEWTQNREELMDLYGALDHWMYEGLDVVPAEDRGHGAPI